MPAFLHHGQGTAGPFMTERVSDKTTKIPARAFTHSAQPQATSRKVLFAGSWRRVFAHWDSRFFIRYEGAEIAVQFTPEASA